MSVSVPSAPVYALVSTGGCSVSSLEAGGCRDVEANPGEGRVDLIAEAISKANGPSEATDDAGVSHGASDVDASKSPPPPVPANCSPVDPTDPCRVDVGEPMPEVSGEPTVTLRDIASFRPSIAGDVMEPNGWAVVGLPANFVSSTSGRQTLAGSLLGRPAAVRFTPVRYAWVSSDGGLVASAAPGATWSQLELPEFTATDTSLVFERSGTFEVRPTITFAAEYRFDGSAWRAIDGTLEVPAAPRSVLVGEFDTVLVPGDCHARPDGPGC